VRIEVPIDAYEQMQTVGAGMKGTKRKNRVVCQEAEGASRRNLFVESPAFLRFSSPPCFSPMPQKSSFELSKVVSAYVAQCCEEIVEH
jgi:hypothetical protein